VVLILILPQQHICRSIDPTNIGGLLLRDLET
jgi:hypothetical protein